MSRPTIRISMEKIELTKIIWRNLKKNVRQDSSIHILGSFPDPWHFGTHPDPSPNPALFVSVTLNTPTKNIFFPSSFTYYFLKAHSHHEVRAENKVFLTIFGWLWKDPDPNPSLWLTDPDPGGPKTYGSYGSRTGTLVLGKHKLLLLKTYVVRTCQQRVLPRIRFCQVWRPAGRERRGQGTTAPQHSSCNRKFFISFNFMTKIFVKISFGQGTTAPQRSSCNIKFFISISISWQQFSWKSHSVEKLAQTTRGFEECKEQLIIQERAETRQKIEWTKTVDRQHGHWIWEARNQEHERKNPE